MSTVKIVKAPAGGGSMNRMEVEDFLAHGKFLLRIATLNHRGDPEIVPIWYHYENGRLYLMTGPDSRKVQNIKRKNSVYFSVDTELVPYKGAKGRATANILRDRSKALGIAEKIVVKYLGDSKSPMGQRYIGHVRDGTEIVVELEPEYFSVWDYGKKG
jgi:nitroimidazol reductase NimA-like FMN-containing flavoprotein (pyridoxamine 5'-phosphate oxidase superfamily)